MFKLPLVIVYAIVAFNISVFTVMLQMDWLIFHSGVAKLIAWAMTIGAWGAAYAHRERFVRLF